LGRGVNHVTFDDFKSGLRGDLRYDRLYFSPASHWSAVEVSNVLPLHSAPVDGVKALRIALQTGNTIYQIRIVRRCSPLNCFGLLFMVCFAAYIEPFLCFKLS